MLDFAPTPQRGEEPPVRPVRTVSGGSIANRPLLALVAIALLFAVVLGVLAARRSPTRAHRRRRRRVVSRHWYARAARAGFRYSPPRDALVLRVVGERLGPVLVERRDRPMPAFNGIDVVAAAPATPIPTHRPAPPLRRRVIDICCAPLEIHVGARRAWQISAVDVTGQRAWTRVVAGGSGHPSPEHLADLLREVADELGGEGKRLGVVVVPDSDPEAIAVRLRHSLGDPALRVLRVRPAAGHRSPAASLHERFVSRHWAPLADSGPKALTLADLSERLQRWTTVENGGQQPAAPPGPPGVRRSTI